MISKEQIIEAIYQAIDEINEQLPQSQQIPHTPDAALFGQEGVLDSLGLVNMIVATEQKLDEELDVIVSLADEKAISQKNSPFKTVSTLADYIIQCIAEEN